MQIVFGWTDIYDYMKLKEADRENEINTAKNKAFKKGLEKGIEKGKLEKNTRNCESNVV